MNRVYVQFATFEEVKESKGAPKKVLDRLCKERNIVRDSVYFDKTLDVFVGERYE